MSRHIQKTRFRLLGWGLADLLFLLATSAGICLLGLFILEYSGASFRWQRGFVLVCLGATLILLILKVGYSLWALASYHRLCRLLEDNNPEFRNDLTTLDYLLSHQEEVRSLGFSTGLMQALSREVEGLPDPAWSRMNLTLSARRWLVISGIAGGLVIPLLWFLAPGPLTSAIQKAFLQGERQVLSGFHDLQIPSTIGVPLHQDLIIPSTGETRISLISSEELPAGEYLEVLVKDSGGFWKTAGMVSGKSSGDEPVSTIHLKIDHEMEVLLLSDTLRSNPCRIVPVYPPAVESSEVVVVPPDYTHHPERTLAAPARVEAMSGSTLHLKWKTNNLLTSAVAQILSETGTRLSSTSLDVSQPRTLGTSLVLSKKSNLRLELTDHFNQTTRVPDLPLLVYGDAIPSVKILSPSRETILKEDLRIPLQALAADDVALSEGILVYRLENGTGGGEIRQRLFDSAGAVLSATTVTLSPLLDLSSANLWPGEQASYWIEVTDWRGPDRPGQVGRSETFTARFPTVDETLEEQASMKAKTTDDFNELLEDQREISRQFREMRQDLQSNQKGRQRGERNWETQKKLEQTVKHQEDVQKKIADVAEKFAESLKRLEEENDISLRTLQKFEQVQELLDQLLSQEAKQVLKELQETLRALEKEQLRPEEMEQTETNLAEFEKQLDRQLELLKNMWLEQEAEHLKEQTEQLAQLQEELKKATQELQKQRDPASATEEAELDSGLEELEELEEVPKGLQEQLEELSEQAQQEAKEKEQQEQAAKGDQQGEKQAGDQQSEQGGEKNQDQPGEQKQEGATEQKPDGQQDGEQPQGKQSQQAEGSEQEKTDQQPPSEEKLLADRQEQLNRETESLLEELKRLEEEAKQQDSPMTKNLQELNKSQAAQSVSKKQQSALSKLQQNQLSQACKSQSRAKKDLDQMASALGGCGGGKDMEEQIAKMKEILERAFLLSENSETNDVTTSRYRPMRAWPNADNMSRLGRQMGIFRQEAARLSAEFKKVAEKNPFADFTVVKRFDQAARNWGENTRVMEEAPPVIVSDRSHQALGHVNLAIKDLLDSLEQSQSQSSGSGGGLEGYFRGLKDMLQKQKQLNQQTQSAKEQMQEGNKNQRLPDPSGKQEQQGQGGDTGDQKQPGKDGEQGSGSEQLKKMAEQQRNIRRQLEELEKRYKEAKGRTGSLEGVGEMMQDVEKDLDHNQLTDQVTETQNKIEQRLLDAEKSMHTQGFKKKRKALQAPGDAPEAVVEESPALPQKEEPESLARLLRQNLEDVSPHWRERIRTYYDSLLKMNP